MPLMRRESNLLQGLLIQKGLVSKEEFLEALGQLDTTSARSDFLERARDKNPRLHLTASLP